MVLRNCSYELMAGTNDVSVCMMAQRNNYAGMFGNIQAIRCCVFEGERFRTD